MPGQIKVLTGLELANLFGWNVLRHTRDPKARRKGRLMAGLYVFLVLVVFLYMGALSYGLILLDAAAAVPAYLIAISSILIFFFGAFTAGAVLFRKGGYDMLCALPLSRTAIVVSRFLRLYVQDLALTLAVTVPGLAVYAWLLRPGIGFWLAAPLGILITPLLPMAAAALVGIVVAGISSRMKRKSLVEAALSLLLVLGVFGLMPKLSGLEETVTPQMLAALCDTVLGILGKLYPPCVWLGTAMAEGDLLRCLGCLLLSAGTAVAVGTLITARFHAICRRLHSSAARHAYRMTQQAQTPLLFALCRREFRRYFASGVYVSNTILGPVLGTVLSAAVFFTGVDRITALLPFPVDIPGLLPFLVAAVFCMMPPVAVSVSMEGKHWWVLKSLPLRTRDILDAKVLMNLLLMLPFFLVSEVFLTLALRPGIPALLWQLLIPGVSAVFSCVFGIWVNLRLPVLDWQNEVSVVKQSAAALLGGMGGALTVVLFAVLTAPVPQAYADLAKLAVCAVLSGITAILYRQNNRTDLKTL